MTGEVIQSFLVSLGFDVDDQSLAKFNKGLETAAKRVTAVAVAVTGMAAGLVAAFSKTSEGFEDLGYQLHIIAPLINKAIVLRQEMIMSYQRAGVNIRQVIVDSIKLNMSIAKTKLAFEAIYKSVASKFFGVIQKQSDDLRKKLYANMPKIIAILTKFVQSIFNAFDWIARFGERAWEILGRVFDVLKDLDQATNGWSTTILAIAAAWKALSLSFLASPLGAVLLLAAALILLYDDYKGFTEGKKSFFNWAPAIPIINGVTDSVKALAAALGDCVDLLGDLGGHDPLQTLRDIGHLVTHIKDIFVGLDVALEHMIDLLSGGVFTKIMNFTAGVENSLHNLTGIGGLTAIGNGNAFPNSPLGSNGPQGGTTNVNATLQTSVNVQGSPNAAATGAAVLGGQKNAQADFIRNLVPKIGPGAPPAGQ